MGLVSPLFICQRNDRGDYYITEGEVKSDNFKMGKKS